MKDNTFNEETLNNELENRVEKVTKKDLQQTIAKSQKIEEKVRSSSLLKREWAKVKLLIMLIKDYMEDNYTEIPWSTIAAIVVALLYILSPIDLIPDIIPIVGYSDDIAILMLVWAGISDDVKRYARWKAERDVEAKQLYAEAFDEVLT